MNLETTPEYYILPWIPDEAKPYFLITIIAFFFLLFLTAKATRVGLTASELMKHWAEVVRVRWTK